MRANPLVRSFLLVATTILGCSGGSGGDGGGPSDASVAADLSGAAGADASGLGDAGGPGPRRLILLHTNDEHSHLFAFAPEVDDFPIATMPGAGTLKGSVGRRMTLLKQERAAATAAGAATLTLSAGDNVMGTLPQVGFTLTAPDFTVMKALGYDATCLGNHEFDFGPAALATALGIARAANALIPTLSTNLHFDPKDTRDDTLAAVYSATPDATKLVEGYHVLTTTNGLKVGLIGIVGKDAAYVETSKAPVTFSLGASLDDNKTDEVMKAIYADLQPVVDTLRQKEKVDLVVALSHSGVDLAKPETGEDYLIAQNVAGIDVIVSGHTHTVMAAPLLVDNPTTKKKVLVQQAGSFGAYLGRIDLTVDPALGVIFNVTDTKLLPIDDQIVPDPTVSQAAVQAMHDLESKPFGKGPLSFLEAALTKIEGAAVKDDPAKEGDLYFRSEAKTGFDITHASGSRETPIFDLAADAMLSAGDKYATPMGEFTDVAIEAGGVLRGALPKGKTGQLAFADLFRIVPLGASPVDGSIGYPMAHTYLYLLELKAAFEVAATYGIQPGSSLFLVPSGMRVTFDTARPAFDPSKNGGGSAAVLDVSNGRITKIEAMSNHAMGFEGPYDKVLFDAAAKDAWPGGPLTLIGVSTSYYIASFAASVGVSLKSSIGRAVALKDTIVHRQDGSEVKEYEIFAEYLRAEAMKNAGAVPARYDEADPKGAVPRRMLCQGPLCPK